MAVLNTPSLRELCYNRRMDISKYLPKDAEEYISSMRVLAAIIYEAMNETERTQFVSAADKAKSLQRLADGVETIACLRGDSGIFYSARPHNLAEHQQEMYEIENTLRTRLVSLGYTYPQQT